MMKKCAIGISLILVSAFFSQCYYIRQGVALLDIYSGAESIRHSLARGDLEEAERATLGLVLEIKRFAVVKLGLAENSNYTTYIRIDRDYLADIVSACERLSFRQYEWSYLLVGRLPYKGFFNRTEAEREAAMLEYSGFDVFVRQVDAFSTLGFFSDPVFSFMKDYPAYVFAELIIHEQTHATVFLPDQATFNENLALFVGQEGMREFLRQEYGAESREYRLAIALEADQAAFNRKVEELFRELYALYESAAGDGEKLAAKEEIIAAWKKRFAEGYRDSFKTDAYRSFPERTINNAVIMTLRNYVERQDDIAALFELCGRDLPRLIGLAKKLKSDEKAPLERLRELIREDM